MADLRGVPKDSTPLIHVRLEKKRTVSEALLAAVGGGEDLQRRQEYRTSTALTDTWQWDEGLGIETSVREAGHRRHNNHGPRGDSIMSARGFLSTGTGAILDLQPLECRRPTSCSFLYCKPQIFQRRGRACVYTPDHFQC